MDLTKCDACGRVFDRNAVVDRQVAAAPSPRCPGCAPENFYWCCGEVVAWAWGFTCSRCRSRVPQPCDLRAENHRVVECALGSPPRLVLDGFGRRAGADWDRWTRRVADALESVSARSAPLQLTTRALCALSMSGVDLDALARPRVAANARAVVLMRDVAVSANIVHVARHAARGTTSSSANAYVFGAFALEGEAEARLERVRQHSSRVELADAAPYLGRLLFFVLKEGHEDEEIRRW